MNHLAGQTSPYLLQHADNPVDWYPWGDEAFERARREDKPVFLSIGYSACHWCHVMAHESFADEEVADMLNRYFISVKVDREERPDIDSVYMRVCQALTGSGGWPTSIFLTPEQKPFFAGTYFPKTGKHGMIGFIELLSAIRRGWERDRASLLRSAESVTHAIRQERPRSAPVDEQSAEGILEEALDLYKQSYDEAYGGFSEAPKFPAPHNLLFLMSYGQKTGDNTALAMAEKTLQMMFAGGLFDHIGNGFCRYSTDRYYLIPHFEKMLYDNALLILAYCRAYELTKKPFYLDVAERTATYVLTKMRAPEGGFYSAQDADSEGQEGKYYLFTPEEVISVLGAEAGEAFNKRYGITARGNFEGKSIPNLLHSDPLSGGFGESLRKLSDYRHNRYRLHTDDKILTAWNGLMIAGLCALYRVSGKAIYLDAAVRAQRFLQERLWSGGAPCVSFRCGKTGVKGFLDDYANEIFALLWLYHASYQSQYLASAIELAQKTLSDFFDAEQGGFYLSGDRHESLIARKKESYDGATPSGNSVMAWNLVRLSLLSGDARFAQALKKQMDFLCGEAQQYPMGYAMALLALSDYLDAPETVTVALRERADISNLPFALPLDGVAIIKEAPTEDYPLKSGKTTYYLCRGKRCLPPANDLSALTQLRDDQYCEQKQQEE